MTQESIKLEAKFKGKDPLNVYNNGETYLLTVLKETSGSVLITLATGQGKRTYKSLQEYNKDWEEVNLSDTPVKIAEMKYSLIITYHPNGTPNLDHENSGMREADIIACLEIAKSQIIKQITGEGKG